MSLPAKLVSWRGSLTVGAVLVLLLLTITTALASHNTSDEHWHAEGTTYQIRSSVPSGWDDDFEYAANEWHDDTDISLTESGSSINYIEVDEIPSGVGCDSGAIACTVIVSITSDHFDIVDIMFNEDTDFGVTYAACWLGLPDVKETAVHEFGHMAGWLEHITSSAVDSVMRYPPPSFCHRETTDHDVYSMNAQYSGSH